MTKTNLLSVLTAIILLCLTAPVQAQDTTVRTDPTLKVTEAGKAKATKILFAETSKDKPNWLKVKNALLAGANTRNKYGTTALITAVYAGQLELVKLLLEHGADVNAPAKFESMTALRWAAQQGHLEIVKLLIEKGARLHDSSLDGYTPLEAASQNGKVEVVKFLLEIITNTTARESAFMGAALSGQLECVKLLLEHGVNIDTKAEDGDTALMQATDFDHLKVAKFLLENGADVNIKDTGGKTALGRVQSKEMRNLLISYGAKE